MEKSMACMMCMCCDWLSLQKNNWVSKNYNYLIITALLHLRKGRFFLVETEKGKTADKPEEPKDKQMGNTATGKTIERKRRSIAKTISWRAIGTLDTILISWLVVGNLNFAVTIGGVELFTKMALYFFHERAWNKCSYGREKQTPIEYEI